MAPQVRKAKTAFLFYQGAQLSNIRAELGPTASMGDAMTEVREIVVVVVVVVVAVPWRRSAGSAYGKDVYISQQQRRR